jgi:hypothetical protein
MSRSPTANVGALNDDEEDVQRPQLLSFGSSLGVHANGGVSRRISSRVTVDEERMGHGDSYLTPKVQAGEEREVFATLRCARRQSCAVLLR